MFHASQQIGIYILINRIGRGGFGEVWLAERRSKFVTTQVAVKLPLDEQVDHATIEQEAQLWAQASGHPNVLPIIEANDYDGQIVIVSEYASDGSLEQLLKNNGGALPVARAVELAAGILKGLEFLHSRKIIHRDLKPANILMQGDTPRLADFGISRAMRTTTVRANIAGTPKYMAPEAFDGKRDARTDIWSIGVLLHQMMAGRLPFPQDNYGELISAIVTKEPSPLPGTVPVALRKVVAKALSKNPANRYSSAREMRDALDTRVEELSITTIVRPVSPIPAPKRTKLLYFAAPTVALLLIAFISIFIGIAYWVITTTPPNTNNTRSAVPSSPSNVANTVKGGTFSSLKLSKDKDVSQETSSFGAKDTIYALATVSNLPSVVKVKGRLVIEKVAGQQSGPIPGLEKTLDLPSDGTATFTFTPPTNGWPKGKYKVDILLLNDGGDQKDRKAASFTVS